MGGTFCRQVGGTLRPVGGTFRPLQAMLGRRRINGWVAHFVRWNQSRMALDAWLSTLGSWLLTVDSWLLARVARETLGVIRKMR